MLTSHSCHEPALSQVHGGVLLMLLPCSCLQGMVLYQNDLSREYYGDIVSAAAAFTAWQQQLMQSRHHGQQAASSSGRSGSLSRLRAASSNGRLLTGAAASAASNVALNPQRTSNPLTSAVNSSAQVSIAPLPGMSGKGGLLKALFAIEVRALAGPAGFVCAACHRHACALPNMSQPHRSLDRSTALLRPTVLQDRSAEEEDDEQVVVKHVGGGNQHRLTRDTLDEEASGSGDSEQGGEEEVLTAAKSSLMAEMLGE